MRKILIIDDSSFQRKIVSTLLQENGFETITAENGRAGIDTALREHPDLITTDLLMPDFDGFYFLEQACARKLGIPVIIISSDIQDATRNRCLSLGADDFLYKPVKKEILISAINKLIGAR